MKQNHAVSQRFIACVAQLKSQKNIRSYRQFACELDFLPQSLSEIIQQRRDVTIDLLQKAIHFYNFNPIFLFTGQGDFFVDKADNNLPTALYEQIIYVPATAQGAYAQQYPSKKLLKELATFALPEFKYKTTLHRAFEITGDSMETGLFEGDKVVANFIPKIRWV